MPTIRYNELQSIYYEEPSSNQHYLEEQHSSLERDHWLQHDTQGRWYSWYWTCKDCGYNHNRNHYHQPERWWFCKICRSEHTIDWQTDEEREQHDDSFRPFCNTRRGRAAAAQREQQRQQAYKEWLAQRLISPETEEFLLTFVLPIVVLFGVPTAILYWIFG